MPPSFDLLAGGGTGGGKAPRVNALALRLRRRRSFWGFGGEAPNSKLLAAPLGASFFIAFDRDRWTVELSIGWGRQLQDFLQRLITDI
jgi:hypothetical protein